MLQRSTCASTPSPYTKMPARLTVPQRRPAEKPCGNLAQGRLRWKEHQDIANTRILQVFHNDKRPIWRLNANSGRLSPAPRLRLLGLVPDIAVQGDRMLGDRRLPARGLTRSRSVR